MRKVVYSIILIFAVFHFSTLESTAQKRITEGYIKYELTKVTSPVDGVEQMLKGTSQTIYFSGKQANTKADMRFVKFEILTEEGNDENLTLMSGMLGDYMFKNMDYEEMYAPLRKAKVKYHKKATRKIAGYKCQKASVKTPEGFTLIFYLTPRITPSYSPFSQMFPQLTGFPLEFMVRNQGVLLTYTATEVSKDKVDSTIFNPSTEGYEERPPEDFEKVLFGGSQ